jgi:polysaccharide biosynthesis/export protein
MRVFRSVLLLFLGLAAARAGAQDSLGALDRSTPPYRIGPGDILQLFVWKEPDLSRDITVRLDGKITVPLLGDVQAGGQTPADLSRDLSERLARFLTAPQVTVGISQALSARYHILGQVLRAGDFPLTRPTTILQGLAVAGGFKDFAKTDSIIIIRQQGDQQLSIPINYKRLENGHDLDQNVLLRPGDTILVP